MIVPHFVTLVSGKTTYDYMSTRFLFGSVLLCLTFLPFLHTTFSFFISNFLITHFTFELQLLPSSPSSFSPVLVLLFFQELLIFPKFVFCFQKFSVLGMVSFKLLYLGTYVHCTYLSCHVSFLLENSNDYFYLNPRLVSSRFYGYFVMALFSFQTSFLVPNILISLCVLVFMYALPDSSSHLTLELLYV